VREGSGSKEEEEEENEKVWEKEREVKEAD